MTVAGEATAVSVDRTAASEEFTAVYTAHRVRLVRYLAMLLGPGQLSIAEDMAQEAFIALWRDLTEKSTYYIDSVMVYGLLKIMGRRAIGSYYKSARSHELAVDYDAPDARKLISASHSYAPDVPGLHSLALELDAAMQRMQQASALWRGLNKDAVTGRRKLIDGGISVRTRPLLEQKVEQTEAAEEKALVEFREACRAVGELRAEMERTAGPNWRSSTGMPHRTNTGGSPLTSAKDPAATHCPKGHLLDRLNTSYAESGDRQCRACARAKDGKKPSPKTSGRSNKTIAPEVIEQARQLLADPALGHSIRSAAELLNLGQMTLYRAFPGGVAAVRQAAALAGSAR